MPFLVRASGIKDRDSSARLAKQHRHGVCPEEDPYLRVHAQNGEKRDERRGTYLP